MEDQDDQDIEDMTPGDWNESGRWDAGHTADSDLLLPYTVSDVAAWAHFHTVPPEDIVDALIEENIQPYGAWRSANRDDVDDEVEVSRDAYDRWRRGYKAQASTMLVGQVQEHTADVEHMTAGELRQEVRRIAKMRPRLPVNNCAHQAAMYGARTCCVCGAEVPRRNPTLDDIPVLE